MRKFELVEGSFQELGASKGAPGGAGGAITSVLEGELLKLREALTRALDAVSKSNA